MANLCWFQPPPLAAAQGQLSSQHPNSLLVSPDPVLGGYALRAPRPAHSQEDPPGSRTSEGECSRRTWPAVACRPLSPGQPATAALEQSGCCVSSSGPAHRRPVARAPVALLRALVPRRGAMRTLCPRTGQDGALGRCTCLLEVLSLTHVPAAPRCCVVPAREL